MWRVVRIGILLFILVIVAGVTWGDRFRTTSWQDTLWIGVFPVNGDRTSATDAYIGELSPMRFAAIENFFRREASAFGLPIERPVRVILFPQIAEPPPALAADAGMPGHMLWSLKARLYAWQQAGGEVADIRVFVLYHDPARTEAVPHSLGLEKGLLGVVYAYAGRELDGANNIVIAHEVLHTLGATDKYDPVTDLPVFPDGYGDPEAEPRFPQQLAEIMAGRTALSPTQAQMPESLDEVVVGPLTAEEINWLP